MLEKIKKIEILKRIESEKLYRIKRKMLGKLDKFEKIKKETKIINRIKEITKVIAR